MIKIPFTLDKWLQDKSQRVVFGEDNRPVRIVCTDFRCEDEDAPVLACVDYGGYERDYCFTTEGTVRKGVHSPETDLFFLAEPDFTKFERAVWLIMRKYYSPGQADEKTVRRLASGLILLARKEIWKERNGEAEALE